MADLRREYSLGGLNRQELDANPLNQFQHWFSEAAATRHGSRWRRIGIALFKLWHAVLGHPPTEVNAMVLATTTKDGRPSARTVLLKGVDERGFIFFTNYDSRKGQEIAENPSAALVFYWPDLERQICVAGTVARLPGVESEAYFKSRPKGSQLAAWASNQSSAVPDRESLDRQWREMEARFAGKEVPCPPNWGGYVLSPSRIEFWQGRPNRFHDRFRYSRRADHSWFIERLSP